MLRNATREIVPHWYTYPPKTSYEDTLPFQYELLDLGALTQCSAYVHIPFCNVKCSFCSLFASAGHDPNSISRYINALSSEIDQTQKFGPNIKFGVLYFGGGTPSLLPESEIVPLVSRFDALRPKEGQLRSVEFSPDTTSEHTAKLWRHFGFDRASIGIQSFNDERLRAMRRPGDSATAQGAIDTLLKSGFAALNADLIFGGYRQSESDWLNDLSIMLSCGVDSCTFHPLAREQKTASERKPLLAEQPITDISTLHSIAVDTFRSAGWLQTSAISFSRSGTPNPLERAEAYGAPTIGFGAGARSYLPSLHISTLPANRQKSFGSILSEYYDAVTQLKKPALSAIRMSEKERRRRSLVLQLHNGFIERNTIVNALEISEDAEETDAIRSLLSSEAIHEVDEGFIVRDVAASQIASLGTRLSSLSVRTKLLSKPPSTPSCARQT